MITSKWQQLAKVAATFYHTHAAAGPLAVALQLAALPDRPARIRKSLSISAWRFSSSLSGSYKSVPGKFTQH